MSKMLRTLLVIGAIIVPMRVDAQGGGCNPPFGYIWLCGSRCGAPGTCSAQGEPGDICMVTDDGYGCFWDPQDPCCTSPGGF
jgi:hypothetical protein